MSAAVPEKTPSHPRRRVSDRRRHRLTSRLAPLVVLATGAFVGGLLVGAGHQPQERVIAKRYLTAWERGEYNGMYQLLSAASRAKVTTKQFAAAYEDAAQMATIERVEVDLERLEEDGGTFSVPARALTQRFGTLAGTVSFGVTDDEIPGVVFAAEMVLPGLRAGEKLKRTTRLPDRATLQARDGSVLAKGANRESDVGPIAAEIVGRVGPIPDEDAARYRAAGYPKGATVGLSGLERQFETRLAGKLGGTLKAGTRVLADIAPQQGGAVRTSIDPDIEQAAVTALAGRLGGVAVLRPRTGEVLALAGLGYSAPQPPGSTFKIITLAAALEDGIAKPKDSYPVETFTTLSGVELENADGESCGGSLGTSFAHSCNTVFAPMGAELGAKRLVEAAEKFGFNEASDIPGAPPAAIPAAEDIGDDLAVGSSAIGQGRVTSTPLRMAEVTTAIANHGERVTPTFLRGEQGKRVQAVPPRIARIVARYMRLVVTDGTGTAAAVPGTAVAGKTGTAELRDTTPEVGDLPPGETVPEEADTTDTTAWFVAYAPMKNPKVAVAMMLVGQGRGGDTAAPAVKGILEAALKD